MSRTTISVEYAKQNQLLHTQYPNYGTGGSKWADVVRWIVDRFAISAVLDYGCGKQSLAQALPELDIYSYDPGVPGLEELPCERVDLVVCTDVLEHVEPESIDAVLDEIACLAVKAAFLVIATRPAIKMLPDGRNAHLLIEPVVWWEAKLLDRFDILSLQERPGHEFSVLVVPKGGQTEKTLLEAFPLDVEK